jgi:hypothetical protein
MPAKVHVTDPFLHWMSTASLDRVEPQRRKYQTQKLANYIIGFREMLKDNEYFSDGN